MQFIGVDLGWRSGATGLCCLSWQGQKLILKDLTCQEPLEVILEWIEHQITPDGLGMVAVDAPTIIPNATGTRLPDRLTHRYFGRYHAGCYPANLQLAFAQRTVGFGLSLEERGFVHAATITPRQPGKYQIEVFPHPAIVHLFGLDRILKYKKGKLADKKAELSKLYDYIRYKLPQLEPSLELNDKMIDASPSTLEGLTGRQVKVLEDRLDSIICAYIGAYWWYWGQERNWVLGDLTSGYIVVPAPSNPDGIVLQQNQRSPLNSNPI